VQGCGTKACVHCGCDGLLVYSLTGGASCGATLALSAYAAAMTGVVVLLVLALTKIGGLSLWAAMPGPISNLGACGLHATCTPCINIPHRCIIAFTAALDLPIYLRQPQLPAAVR
jgi:hypothetical protein